MLFFKGKSSEVLQSSFPLGLFLSWTTACADFSHALNLPVVVRPSLLCERLTSDFGTAAKDSLIGDGRATFVALQHQSTYQRRRVKHAPGNSSNRIRPRSPRHTWIFDLVGTVRFDELSTGCDLVIRNLVVRAGWVFRYWRKVPVVQLNG